MLTKLLDWIDTQLLKLDPKEQERRHQEYLWKIERMTKSTATGRYRLRSDETCLGEACVERIRLNDGPMEG